MPKNVDFSRFRAHFLCAKSEYYIINKISKLQPEISCGILYGEDLFKSWEYVRTVGIQVLHFHYLYIIPDEVRQS